MVISVGEDSFVATWKDADNALVIFHSILSCIPITKHKQHFFVVPFSTQSEYFDMAFQQHADASFDGRGWAKF